MNSRSPCSSSRIPCSSNEDINLPFGFVFSPTDAELVEGYLLPKLKGNKLPSNYILDLDNVYQYDPPNLPYKLKHARANEAFFFTTDYLKAGEEEGRVRPTPGGYWKAYGDDVPIYRGNRMIGFKTKLCFHDNVNDYFTHWKMNQFKCHPSRIPPATTRTMKNYIICKIKLRKLEEEEEEEEVEVEEEDDENFVEVISEDEDNF